MTNSEDEDHPETAYPIAKSRIEKHNEIGEYGDRGSETSENDENDSNNEEPGSPASTPTPHGPEMGKNPLFHVPMTDGGVSECEKCEGELVGIEAEKSVKGKVYKNGTFKGKSKVKTEQGDKWCAECDILYFDGGRVE